MEALKYPRLILICLMTFGPLTWADRVAVPDGAEPRERFVSNAVFERTHLRADAFTPYKKEGKPAAAAAKRKRGKSPKSRAEIVCLLKAIEVKPDDAEKAADAFERALNALGLDEVYFNTVSFLHFLAQTAKESAGFHKLVQDHDKDMSANKIGYGYIQVTGTSNRREAADCMKEADPGSEQGVENNPLRTIGRVPYLAALASLCWWKNNVMENPHGELARSPSPQAAEKLTRLVNAGAINKPVTDGQRNIEERKATFKKLLEVEREKRCEVEQ